MMRWTIWMATVVMCLSGTVALGQNIPTPNPDPIYQDSLIALTKLFVLAVLLENAFALIFNWRIYQAYFSGRGTRTLVMVAVALLLVYQLDLDIVADLVKAYDGSTANGMVTGVVTALILAGGSSGVNTVMHALGYRDNKAEEAAVEKPPKDKAWIAIRVVRRRATGEVFVRIRELGAPATTDAAPVAGTVGGTRPTLHGLLLRDRNRFPQNGGYDLRPNVLYEITVEGRDNEGQRIAPIDAQKIVLAPAAIVDLEATL